MADTHTAARRRRPGNPQDRDDDDAPMADADRVGDSEPELEDGGHEESEGGEESEDELQPPRKRTRRSRRHAALMYLDMQVEVDDDEEEEEEDEGEWEEGQWEEEGSGLGDATDGAAHRDITRRLHADHADTDDTPEVLAAALRARYAGAYTRNSGHNTDSVSQRDRPHAPPPPPPPRLEGRDLPVFAVKCRSGREMDVVAGIARRCWSGSVGGRGGASAEAGAGAGAGARVRPGTGAGPSVLACFARHNLRRYIYIEARSKAHVGAAVDTIGDVYPGRGLSGVTMLDDGDVRGLLFATGMGTGTGSDANDGKVCKVKTGEWVRVRRPTLYAGDLAQVVSVDQDESCTVRMVPRLEPVGADFQRRDIHGTGMGGKRKKGVGGDGVRPAAKLFNAEDWPPRVVQVLANGNRRLTHVGKTVDAEGYYLAHVALEAVEAPIADPTLDEVQAYLGGSLAAASGSVAGIGEIVGNPAVSDFAPGEEVEVTNGQLRGMVGKVHKVEGSAVVVKLDGLKDVNPFTPNDLRKRFRTGDHVRVLAGQFALHTGSVLKIAEPFATLLADATKEEIQVFSKDLRLAAQAGAEALGAGGRTMVGARSHSFDLLDLVNVDYQTVGCITSLAADSAVLVDQNGTTKRIPLSLLTKTMDALRFAVADAQGLPLMSGDMVLVSPANGPRGVHTAHVVHVYKGVVFCRSKDVRENGGVFVVPATDLMLQSQRGGSRVGSSQAPGAGVPGTGRGGVGVRVRERREQLVGQHVVLQGGAYKGYHGVVKEVTETTVRVELDMNARVVSVDRQKVATLGPDGTTNNSSCGGSSYGGFSGNQTPSQTLPRTPNYGFRALDYEGGRTPAWDGARTPGRWEGGANWGSGPRTPGCDSSGAKTPAWDAASQTPGRFARDGSRSPRWRGYAGAVQTPGPFDDYDTPYAPETPAGYAQTPLSFELNPPTHGAISGGISETP
ncbi:hypothetical protein M427DRAFT_58850 [Gonapodya prolifera JEL478]|uniref:Chromatin elongation factor SPT5 n=1 Tax=Gonapodya prolifera (strain JEL478) TaxID=1344416 RepID=A0A139AAD5_GONPJ|nr:hypothetical protein M427DRAFT_58850 [Gonapodya prolifera JEL478]|eukprot:KXS13333.1 hypothetical protein M427DRAFT_58850 [Gonapodya prolifera JEL478]